MKLALVTGGCHRVGAAIAGRLAEAGWTLALHAREEATPDPALVAALGETEWRGFVADLADARQVAGLIAEVEQAFGAPPALLVNNASVFGQDDVAAMTGETLAHHFAVNAAAPVILARDAAARGARAIVNILDQRIRAPGGDQASYTLSKLALAGATEQLARALAPATRVNAVAPGVTLPAADFAPGQMERLAPLMPLSRLPASEDIADAVLYLAEARAVTGQTIFVDGGAHLKSWGRDFAYL